MGARGAAALVPPRGARDRVVSPARGRLIAARALVARPEADRGRAPARPHGHAGRAERGRRADSRAVAVIRPAASLGLLSMQTTRLQALESELAQQQAHMNAAMARWLR